MDFCTIELDIYLVECSILLIASLDLWMEKFGLCCENSAVGSLSEHASRYPILC